MAADCVKKATSSVHVGIGFAANSTVAWNTVDKQKDKVGVKLHNPTKFEISADY